MRELVFALTFTGQAGPEPGSDTRRRAHTVAPSQLSRTVLGEGGVEGSTETIDGERAVLDSRVERFADGSFVEDGTIAFGRAGTITFETVGRGTVGPSPIEGWVHGAVLWVVTGGDGLFAGARGLITSNFVASARGEVIDNQFLRIYLPA